MFLGNENRGQTRVESHSDPRLVVVIYRIDFLASDLGE